MISKKVDIIVPVYNKSNFLNNLLNSFLNLSSTYFNVLIIDDGSNDNSVEVVKDYLFNNKVDNIFLHEKQNGGVSSARNYGIDKALSEYLWFFDPDDKINDDFFKKLEFIFSIQEDIIVFNFTFNDLKRKKIIDFKFEEYGVFSKKYFLNKHNGLTSQTKNINLIWNKFYKRDFIGNIRFNENLNLGEDRVFNLDLFCKEGNVLLLDIPNYSYFLYEGDTLSTSLNMSKIIDIYDSNYYQLKKLNFERADCKAHIIEQLKSRTIIGCYSLLKFYIDEHKKLSLKIFPLYSYEELILLVLISLNLNVMFYKLYSFLFMIRK